MHWLNWKGSTGRRLSFEPQKEEAKQEAKVATALAQAPRGRKVLSQAWDWVPASPGEKGSAEEEGESDESRCDHAEIWEIRLPRLGHRKVVADRANTNKDDSQRSGGRNCRPRDWPGKNRVQGNSRRQGSGRLEAHCTGTGVPFQGHKLRWQSTSPGGWWLCDRIRDRFWTGRDG